MAISRAQTSKQLTGRRKRKVSKVMKEYKKGKKKFKRSEIKDKDWAN